MKAKGIAADRWMVFYYEQRQGYGGLAAQDPDRGLGGRFLQKTADARPPEPSRLWYKVSGNVPTAKRNGALQR